MELKDVARNLARAYGIEIVNSIDGIESALRAAIDGAKAVFHYARGIP